MRGKIVRIIRACKLSKPILHYVSINARELCPWQACELSGACELVRVKLSGLYCISEQIILFYDGDQNVVEKINKSYE